MPPSPTAQLLLSHDEENSLSLLVWQAYQGLALKSTKHLYLRVTADPTALNLSANTPLSALHLPWLNVGRVVRDRQHPRQYQMTSINQTMN